MSANLKKYLPVLLTLSDIKDEKLSNLLLRYYSKRENFRKALREISRNVIKGNIPLSKYRKAKIKRFRDNIYSVAQRPVKQHIVQSGGWLWIIPTIASLLR